ncbi:unnamed protein product [Calypogeia fissa]
MEVRAADTSARDLEDYVGGVCDQWHWAFGVEVDVFLAVPFHGLHVPRLIYLRSDGHHCGHSFNSEGGLRPTFAFKSDTKAAAIPAVAAALLNAVVDVPHQKSRIHCKLMIRIKTYNLFTVELLN